MDSDLELCNCFFLCQEASWCTNNVMCIDGNYYNSLDQSATLPQKKGYRIEALNRLSYPKGKLPKCDMSGHPATVALVTPSITLYYATEEQAEQAWYGKRTER